MSLRLRVILSTVLIACATALVTGGALGYLARGWVYEDAQEAALTTFRHEMEMFDKGRDLSELGPDTAVFRDGRVVEQGGGVAPLVPPEMENYLQRLNVGYRFQRMPDGQVLVGHSLSSNVLPPGASAVTIYRLAPLGDVSARLRQLTLLIAAASVGGGMLGGAVGLVLARLLTRPLRRLKEVAAQVASGDRDARLPETSVAELRDMTTTFNAMLDRQSEVIEVLSREEERSRRFVSDVSHELRSPLAALVPAAEVLREQVRGDGPPGRAARLVGREIDELAQLVEDLLEMTRRDAGTVSLQIEELEVRELVGSALERRGWSRVAVSGRPAVLRTDPRRVVAVVTNLVGNALRHGAEPVTVAVDPTADGALVTVRDRGDGVPAGHEEAVFTRLHKVAEARTRSGGVGLGLAIARENARLLGGDVRYARDGGETVFTAWFVDRPAKP
ncbi:cell wall metabolism sensor histidine kinase WalK [Tsukamurella sp. 1534]|uniref:sensor histidine kinase n=1 Tax=Tsukamurella sp. 1534 TaxID=1151061 RepID=UPI0002F01C15|nr:HAMP domain-containing sensor histidine kinase [Tsukamurella sp. 1534]